MTSMRTVTAASVLGRALLSRMSRPRRAVGLVIVGALHAVIVVLSVVDGQAAGGAYLDGAVSYLLALAVPLVAVVLASDALGGEVEDRTLGFWLLTPAPRWVIAAAALGASMLTALAIALIGWLIGGVVAVAMGAPIGSVLALGLAVVVATCCYSALVVPLGLIAKPATSIAVTYVLVVENVLARALDNLAVLSPWRWALAAADAVRGSTSADLGSLNPGLGWPLVMTVVLLATSVGLTALLLGARDIE